jgi:TrmH family RNA methyltransferase
VEEALRADWVAQLLLYTPDVGERGKAVCDDYNEWGIPVLEVTSQVMKAASDTQTPQGLLAVFCIPQHSLPPDPDLLLIVDGVRDPGNLGTIMRTSAGANVDTVLLTPGSVDPYSPKVVRAGMGAHFKLPIQSMKWEALRLYLDSCAGINGLQVFLADAIEGDAYTKINFRKPVALWVGGEAEGTSEEAKSLFSHRVRIPMPGDVESLNAAVAMGILLYEVLRQRSD